MTGQAATARIAEMAAGDRPYRAAVFSPHARAEMTRRGISEAEVAAVLSNSGRQAAVRRGRVVLTSLQEAAPGGRAYVLRVSSTSTAHRPWS